MLLEVINRKCEKRVPFPEPILIITEGHEIERKEGGHSDPREGERE
jgi:hypothetical protein